jgi:hypothetical protein
MAHQSYEDKKKLDPASVVRKGEMASVVSPILAGAGKAMGKAARKGAKGMAKGAAAKKGGRRSLRKLTSKQRAEYMVRTRGRKGKKMGR